MLERVIIFLVAFGAGVLIIKYTEPIVRIVGKSAFAEKHLGMGGTYNMWKIIAVVVMVVGFLFLIGAINLGEWGNLGLDSQNKSSIDVNQESQ